MALKSLTNMLTYTRVAVTDLFCPGGLSLVSYTSSRLVHSKSEVRSEVLLTPALPLRDSSRHPKPLTMA